MTIRSEASRVGSIQPHRWLNLGGRLVPLLLLVAAGAGLRFYDLGYRSLWLDEVATAVVIRLPDLSSVLGYVTRDPSATPLTYLVTWLLRPIGGDEFAIRLPYAIAGLLAVIALYALAARLYGRAIGLVAGALMAILPYAIFFSQEARSYAFLMLLTTAVMLSAYRAANRGRARDWAFLTIAGALDLYTGYLAIAVLLAAYGYIGLVLAGNIAVGWRASRLREALATSARAGAMAILTAAFIGAAFLPWFGRLEVFLARRDQAFGRVADGYQPTLNEAQSLLQQLDFHGILLWLLVAGIACAVIDMARGRWQQSLVPLAWFSIPLLGFAVGTGAGIVAIWPRYFGTVYPAAVLLAAVGIDGLARLVATVARMGQRAWSRRRYPAFAPVLARQHVRPPALARAVVLVCLSGFVAVDALPADAAAYTRAKGSDYRGAVDAMLEADPGHPMVLVVGENPDWTVSGLDYYSWVRGSRLAVRDALKLNEDDVKGLEGGTSVWGAVLNAPDLPSPPTEDIAASLFADIWLLRPVAAQAAPIDQARSILSWGASFEPEVTATLQLIEVLQGHSTPGPELLPSAIASQREGSTPSLGGWILQPGTSVSADGGAFVLEPGGQSINVYLTGLVLQPRGQYILSFSCGSSELVGTASVFAVVDGPEGQTAFPDGAGYQCRGSPQPDQGVFAFTAPDSATSVTVWLRAAGSGTAGFERVSLRSLQ